MPQTQTVTVLFCDLTGSTELLTRLGDDANDRVRRSLFATLREAIAAHRGDEVKTIGDNIMVAFPQSAAAAVSCAVAMQRGVSRLNARDPLLGLSVRIGISSGEASHEEDDWFGAPVVEASRLEGAARPNQILVSDVVRALVGTRGGHTFTSVGAVSLKGLPEPVAACDVAWEPDPGLSAIPLPSGLDRSGLPFVGREAAMATLQGAWDGALGGQRRFVLVTGDEGIGKTRLAAEFAAHVHSDEVTVLYGRSETDREIPYQPFVEALRWYVAAAQPQNLRELVGDDGGVLASFIANLQTRLPELPPAPPVDADSERARLFVAVAGMLGRAAARGPLLLVLDDMESASDQTLGTLAHLVERVREARLLVVALSAHASVPRLERLLALPGTTRIDLGGLSTADVASLLERTATRATPGLAERIQRETEGSPRFVAELLERLREGGATQAGSDVEAVLESACPYMGLRTFEPDDAALYFGRDEVIGALLSRLATGRLLSVVGASGSGKSSLVRAGLVPALRRGALPGSRDWRVVIMTPGATPLAELAARLAALGPASAASLLRDLESDPRALDLAVRGALANDGPGGRVVLVVDQFEELFTLTRDSDEQRRFVDALLHAVSVPGGRTTAVLAMRADFYGEAAGYPGFAEALETSHALLGPMNREDLRAAVEGPAAAAGLRLEQGLSDRILTDVGDEPGGLPLLSHALLETWRRREGRTLTQSGYQATGGVRGAIAQTAEASFGRLNSDEQALARNVFVRLTELGEGTEDTRRRVAFAEVVTADAQGERTRAVISALADARLLTTSEGTVEVAHEALIREWPRLRGWLDDDREGLRLMRHLTESAQSWERLGRDDGELYRGARLTAAMEWAERAGPELNPLEREFLDASRELHERELREARARARRLRILAAAATALAVVALVVGGFAGLQWSRANDERDQADEQRTLAETAAEEANRQRLAAVEARLAAEASAVEAILARLETEIPVLVKTDRSLAFALAAEAHNLQPGARTDALMNVVLGDDPRYLGRIFPSEPSLSGYDLSPDGKYIALRTTSGLLELYDADTRALVTSIQAEPTGVSAPVVFLPDGGSILTSTFDQPNQHFTLVFRDVPGLAELQRFEFSSVQTVGGRLQSDGRQFLMTIDGVLHIVDVVDWTERTVAAPQPVYGAPVLDPLGRYMVALVAPFASVSNRVGIFDATTVALVRSVPAIPASFLFTPDGNLLVISYGSAAPGRADLWNPETGELLATTSTQQDAGLVGLDSTGAYAAFTTATSQLGIVSLPGLEPVTAPFETLSRVTNVPRFDQGDDRLYNHALTYALEHWDLSGSGPTTAYTEATGPGNIGLAPDGSWFVKQTADGHWSRWRVPGLTPIDRSASTAGDATLTPSVNVSVTPAVSADGKYFATGHSDCRQPSQVACAGSVVVWDATTGRPVGEPVRVPTEGVRNQILLEFHPDLPLLAIAGNENLVMIVSLEDGTPRVRGSFTVENLTTTLISSFDFLPTTVAQSATLIVHTGQLMSVWDAAEATAVRLGTWNAQATVRGMAVAPDGTVALVRTSGELQFVDYRSLVAGIEPQPISVVPGVVPPGQGGFPRFSADGRTVAITNRIAGTVSVWDVEAKASVGSSFGWGTPTGAWPSPDGKSLLVASDQATILWDLDTALWAEKVCFAAGRNLTEAEWAKYFPGLDYQVTCPQWPAKPAI